MLGFSSVFAILFSTFFLDQVLAEEPVALVQPIEKRPVFVGKLFDAEVPEENYYFARGVLAVFGNKWGSQPQTEEEINKATWDQLLLSYEAFRRGVDVNREEIEQEIDKILQSEKVEFDWRKDKEAYEKWVRGKVNEPRELFENQIRHLLQIEKLRQIVMESIEPTVKEKEVYQEFLNEHNTLGVELVEFEVKKEATKFYNEVKGNPKKWDGERGKRPNDFKRPGSVSLEFLIDTWRFPKDAAYKMIKMEIGWFYPPAPIYKRYAVFKVLDKRLADKKQYKKSKKSFYEQIKRRKRYDELGKWFQDLKRQANTKMYDIKKEERG